LRPDEPLGKQSEPKITSAKASSFFSVHLFKTAAVV